MALSLPAAFCVVGGPPARPRRGSWPDPDQFQDCGVPTPPGTPLALFALHALCAPLLDWALLSVGLRRFMGQGGLMALCSWLRWPTQTAAPS